MRRKLIGLIFAILFVMLLPVVAMADSEISYKVVTVSGETSLEDAIKAQLSESATEIAALKIVTEGNAKIKETDFTYMYKEMTALIHIDMGEAKCENDKIPDIAFCDSVGDSSNNWNPSVARKIETFVFPKTLKEVGKYAFFSAGLKELDLPETLEVIGNNAFGQCTSITGELKLPDGLITIDSNAFSNIPFTGDLYIPDTVTYLGQNVFLKCTFDGTLHISTSVKKLLNNTFGGTANTHNQFKGNLVIPDSVETIGNWVFAGGAFADGTWTLGEGLASVGDAALSNICSGNNGTFFVPAKLNPTDTSFGYNTFDKIVFEDGTTKIATRIVRNSESITAVEMPNTVTEIKTQAFLDCSSLETVFLSNTLNSIESSAFKGTAIKGIFIPETVTTIGSVAFNNLPEGSVIYVPTEEIKTLMLADNTNEWNRRFDPSKTALAITNGGTIIEGTTFALGKLEELEHNEKEFVGWVDEDGNLSTTATPGGIYYASFKGIKSIEITTSPEKTEYKEGESFDKTGMVVTVTYEDDSTAEVTDYTITPNGRLKPSDEKVIIEYKGVTAEVTIEVKPNDDGGTPVYDTSDATDPDNFENGEVSANFANPSAGVLVTLTVTPDEGYEVGEITIIDANGKEIEVIDNGDGTYSYRQPASEIEIDIEFVEIEEETEEIEEEPVEEPKDEIVLIIGNTNAIVNGEIVTNDVAPVIRNGRTMLPIRFIVEELGGKIEWDDEVKKVTITKGDLTIEIFIGSPFALVNGNPVELDSPAFIENGRTYLPVRFVADYLGADVEWIDETKTVIITEK